MKKIFVIILIASVFTACEIERLPNQSLPAEKITGDPAASLNELVTGCYAQMKGWSDVMHRCGEYAGDNIMIRGASTDAFYEFISYSRTPANYRLQTFWDNSYKAIAQSSNIIGMIKEGESAEIDNRLGECYFLRGLMYFYLCRAYGRPYSQNPETSLGVPIQNGTPADMMNLKLPDRSTVKETYAQAIADMKKARTLLTLDKGAIYASREAAWAILSRIYLYMSGTWSNPNREYARLSLDYADSVINSGKYRLLSREDFMKYNTILPENNMESIFVVRRIASEFSGYDHYYGIGGMYANIGGMGWGEMYASAKHIALLDETGRNDWYKNKIVDARAAFIEPQYFADKDSTVFRFIKNSYDTLDVHIGFAYAQLSADVNGDVASCKESKGNELKTYSLTPVDVGQGIWSIVYQDGNSYTGYIDQFIRLNRTYPMFYIVKCSREGEDSHLHSPVITRLAEMYLNKSEAAGKLGEYSKALEALNIVRERSLPGKGYASLTADNAETLIDKERTLELAFQAERSYDVYRNGRSLTRRYPGPHKSLDEISPTDYRVVYFIPQNAINAYTVNGNTLTQNPMQ
jgi:hypothetical protein